MDRFEEWAHGNGLTRIVTVFRRFICEEDICPDCGRTILVAVAADGEGGKLFRLECLFCPWTTDALPDPETGRRAFKRCPNETVVARRLAIERGATANAAAAQTCDNSSVEK